MTAPMSIEVRPKLYGLPTREVVYLVQLEPELAPTRLKVGYTRSLERRLRQFRAVCPAARLLHSADGDRSLEAAMLSAFDVSFRRIGRELFEATAEAAEKRFDQVAWELSH